MSAERGAKMVPQLGGVDDAAGDVELEGVGLDDLDAHAWVLEPKNPGRECVSRRIALGDHCSLQLELHAAAPTSLEGANRWTDNIFVLRSHCQTKFNTEPAEFNQGLEKLGGLKKLLRSLGADDDQLEIID